MKNFFKNYAVLSLALFASVFAFGTEALATDTLDFQNVVTPTSYMYNSISGQSFTAVQNNISKVTFKCISGDTAATSTLDAFLCSGTATTTASDCLSYGRHWMSGQVGQYVSCSPSGTENSFYFSQVVALVPGLPYYVLLRDQDQTKTLRSQMIGWQTTGDSYSGGQGIAATTDLSSVSYLSDLYFKVYYNPAFIPGESSDTTALPEMADIFATSTHSMVCTDEEWNATSTYLGMNFTTMKCSILQSMLDITDKAAHYPAVAAQGVVNVLGTVFPLNIFVKFKESWDSSATTALPSALTYIDMADSSGNVYFTRPAVAGLATSSPQLIWGPSLFTSNATALALIAFIKAFSTYLFWYLFIMQLYRYATTVADELGDKD